MALTLAQIITDFKNLVGPAGKGTEVSDPGLKIWANDAYVYIIGEIQNTNPDYFAKKSTSSTQENVGEYTLPSDFDRSIMTSVTYDGTNYVRALPLNNIGQALDLTNTEVAFTTAQPFYYILKNTIGFLPVFTASVDSAIKLWYAYNPTELTEDTDTPDLPDKLVRLMKYSMYANYLDQNDEHVAAERMRVRFEDGVRKVIDSMTLQVDQPRTVEITDSGLYFEENY